MAFGGAPIVSLFDRAPDPERNFLELHFFGCIRMPTILKTIFGLLLLSSMAGQAIAQGRIDYIAFSGQLSPDGNGTLTTGISFSNLNASGEISISGILTGTSGGFTDDRILLRGTEAGLTIVARSGQTVPDGNGTYSGFTGSVHTLDDASGVYFTADLTGTTGGSTDDRVLCFHSGANSIVHREGQPVPGGNGVFSTFLNPEHTASGLLFEAILTGTSGGTGDDSGMYFRGGNATMEVVREGMAPPGGNGVVSQFINRDLNSQGKILYSASLTSSSATNRGIYLWDNGTTTTIARKGQASPDGDGTISDLTILSLNDAGQLAFHSRATGNSGGSLNNDSLWIRSGTTTTLAVRKGQTVPGGNGTFASFGVPLALLNSGDLMFQANLSGTSGGTSDDSGLFRRGNSGVIELIREGHASPDGNGFVSEMGGPKQFNQYGVAAAAVTLSGTTGGASDNFAVILSDGIDRVLAVRTGRQAYGLTQTVITLPNVFGTNWFNDFGQVAFRSTFNNGSIVIEKFTPDLSFRATASGAWDDRLNWTLGLPPAYVHRSQINPATDLTVWGPVADQTIRSLELGMGPGQATLHLDPASQLTALQGMTVGANGKLSGSGIVVAEVNVEGILSPGSSAGWLEFLGELNLQAASELEIGLGGLNNEDFDRLIVDGDLSLAGGLDVFFENGFSLGAHQQFVIVELTGGRTGEFAGLGQGSLVGTFGGFDLLISYFGGDGNDIMLFTVPEPILAFEGLMGLACLAIRGRRRRDQSSC